MATLALLATATLSLDVAALDESMNSRALAAFQASKRAQELKAQMIDTPFDTSLRLTCSDAVKQLFVPRFAFPVHLCRNVSCQGIHCLCVSGRRRYDTGACSLAGEGSDRQQLKS